MRLQMRYTTVYKLLKELDDIYIEDKKQISKRFKKLVVENELKLCELIGYNEIEIDFSDYHKLDHIKSIILASRIPMWRMELPFNCSRVAEEFTIAMIGLKDDDEDEED